MYRESNKGIIQLCEHTPDELGFTIYRRDGMPDSNIVDTIKYSSAQSDFSSSSNLSNMDLFGGK